MRRSRLRGEEVARQYARDFETKSQTTVSRKSLMSRHRETVQRDKKKLASFS